MDNSSILARMTLLAFVDVELCDCASTSRTYRPLHCYQQQPMIPKPSCKILGMPCHI